MIWNTRQVLSAEFRDAWNAGIATDPRSHFEFRLDYLASEAAQGRHASCRLTHGGGFVMTETRRGPECGRPWRTGLWGHADPRSFPGRWFYPSGTHAHGYRAGSTVISRLGIDKLDGNKRRAARKCEASGYSVIEATDPARMRAFHELQIASKRERGETIETDVAEPWVEWTAPWHWLLLAVHEGTVVAGSGFGVLPGASVEYRTNASTPCARKDGANTLLASEAIRLATLRGFAQINWCGATTFKRTLGGRVVEMEGAVTGGLGRLEVWSRRGMDALRQQERRLESGLRHWGTRAATRVHVPRLAGGGSISRAG